MSIDVTGTYKPDSVAASVYECGSRVVILHVPRHVSMIQACMQHSALLKEADVTLRTFGLDVVPGQYQVVDAEAGMAAFTERTGAVHHTSPEDDIGHVTMGVRAIAALGKRVRRVIGEKPPEALYTTSTR